MVAWELTRNCNLNCVHCRAAASKGPQEGELTLSECKQVLDQIAGFASPTIILTGGEPLMRDDIFDIVDYGNAKGLRLVMAINGTLKVSLERRDKESVKKINSGVRTTKRNNQAIKYPLTEQAMIKISLIR